MTEPMPSQPEPIDALARAEINLPAHLIPTFGRADLARLWGAAILLLVGLCTIGVGIWFVIRSLPGFEEIVQTELKQGSSGILTIWLTARAVALVSCFGAGYAVLRLADRLSQPLHLKMSGLRDPQTTAEELSHSIKPFITRIVVPLAKALKERREPNK